MVQTYNLITMNLLALPAFSDNYLWLLHDEHHALVVDPGQSEPVLQALQEQGLQLQAILVTHHHADHVGGVQVLREATGAAGFTALRASAFQPPFTRWRRATGWTCWAWALTSSTCQATPPATLPTSARQVDGAPLLFCGDTFFRRLRPPV